MKRLPPAFTFFAIMRVILWEIEAIFLRRPSEVDFCEFGKSNSQKQSLFPLCEQKVTSDGQKKFLPFFNHSLFLRCGHG